MDSTRAATAARKRRELYVGMRSARFSFQAKRCRRPKACRLHSKQTWGRRKCSSQSASGSQHSPWHPCRAVTFRAAGPIAPQFKQRAAKKVQYSITGIYSIGLGLLILTRRAHKSIYQLIKVCFLTSKTDGIGQKRLACQTANHGCPLHKITHLSWGMVAL